MIALIIWIVCCILGYGLANGELNSIPMAACFTPSECLKERQYYRRLAGVLALAGPYALLIVFFVSYITHGIPFKNGFRWK